MKKDMMKDSVKVAASTIEKRPGPWITAYGLKHEVVVGTHVLSPRFGESPFAGFQRKRRWMNGELLV
jgi:hypothetical protein